jgi:hypothetical protein
MPSRLCTPTLPLPLNDLPLRLEDRLQADTLAAMQELMLTIYQAQDLLATLPDLPSPDLGTRPQQAATKAAPHPRDNPRLPRVRRGLPYSKQPTAISRLWAQPARLVLPLQGCRITGVSNPSTLGRSTRGHPADVHLDDRLRLRDVDDLGQPRQRQVSVAELMVAE